MVPPPTLESRYFKSRVAAGSPLLVDKESANASRTRVEVLVGAPDGEVDVPVVQPERHVADRVSQVDSNGDALGVSCLRQPRDVEQLSRVVLDPRHHEDCD